MTSSANRQQYDREEIGLVLGLLLLLLILGLLIPWMSGDGFVADSADSGDLSKADFSIIVPPKPPVIIPDDLAKSDLADLAGSDLADLKGRDPVPPRPVRLPKPDLASPDLAPPPPDMSPAVATRRRRCWDFLSDEARSRWMVRCSGLEGHDRCLAPCFGSEEARLRCESKHQIRFKKCPPDRP